MLVMVDVKQLAWAAANSSSGFVAPPGPPSSTWAAVAVASMPEALSTVPPKPCQSTVARAS